MPPENEKAHTTAVAVKRKAAQDTEGVLHTSQANIQSMQVVLQQVQAIGNANLEAQVLKAITMEERRVRILAREHPEVTRGFLDEQDADRRRVRREHASIRKAFSLDQERRLTIRELREQQDKL